VLAEPISAYQEGIVGKIRHLLTDAVDREFVRNTLTGDPARVAQAIIQSVDVSPAPRRLTLGSNAYEAIAATWRDRLAALEAQRDLAYSTDADDIRVRGRA
jgi:hypothetical protein